MDQQPKNPLHGVKLEKIVTDLEAYYGWERLAEIIKINCFLSNPSVKSSLKFLRKTPWAREKVEGLFLDTFFSNSKKTSPKREQIQINPWLSGKD
jgi:uncharacterized protein (DUF2132 family)